MSGLVVKNHRPWQYSIAIIIMSMVVAGLTWLLLDNSHWSIITDKININNDNNNLMQLNNALEQKNLDLQDQVLMSNQTAEIDTQTAGLLQQDLKALQDEIFYLKQELEFYQGVMDSSRTVVGLEVNGMYIEPLSKENNYRMKLILTHVAKSNKVMEGKMAIEIEGTSNELKHNIDLKEITIDKLIDLSFKVKSFSRIEYNFVLPSNFYAERVFIQLRPNRKNDPVVDKVYDWPIVTH